MKMGYKYILYLAIPIFVSNVACGQTRIDLVKKSVQNIVKLSVYGSDLLADQAEMILVEELSAIDAESEFNNRVNGLIEVRDITQVLLGRLSTDEVTSNLDIMDIDNRINTAYDIGERLYLGELLGIVIDSVSDINILPDLLDFISKIPESEDSIKRDSFVSSGSDEIKGEEIESDISKAPNIYRDITRPNIYQEVMNKLHNDFRESTTTKDGGGFKESDNDATPI